MNHNKTSPYTLAVIAMLVLLLLVVHDIMGRRDEGLDIRAMQCRGEITEQAARAVVKAKNDDKVTSAYEGSECFTYVGAKFK